MVQCGRTAEIVGIEPWSGHLVAIVGSLIRRISRMVIYAVYQVYPVNWSPKVLFDDEIGAWSIYWNPKSSDGIVNLLFMTSATV